MDTGAKKRKRSLVKDYCANCGKDGGNGLGHLVQYCGFPGGKFYKHEDPVAGRKLACRAKFNDEAKAKAESKEMDQISMLAAAESKEKQVQDLQRKVEDLEGKMQSMAKALQRLDEKYDKRTAGLMARIVKGKGKGKGQAQPSQSQSPSPSQSQIPSQSQRPVVHYAQPTYVYSQPWA
jgi:hypothetical protein